jgi:PHD/YefM family antitoxin component YafN of YafNO toxin-antitoxin module
MNTVSISQLKTNPSKAIDQAFDYPVAIEKRNKIKAYLLGKDLYEKIIAYFENYIDRKTVEKTDFTKGKDFEKVARDLGL